MSVSRQASVFGCQCPGVPYLAGYTRVVEPHYETWEAYHDEDEPWPAATQEDGLCDPCRDECEAAAKQWKKERP